jgi:hypothetical protein
MSFLLLAVSVASFAGIAYSVFLPWVKMTAKFKVDEGEARRDIELLADGRGRVAIPSLSNEVSLKDNQRPEGFYLMLLAVAGAVLVAVAFASAAVGKFEGASRAVFTLGVVASAGVAMTLIVWQLAWVWKVVSLDKLVTVETPTQVESYRSFGQREIITAHGMGLYLGIGLALAAALFVSMAAKNHVRMSWLRLAEALGFIAGAVIMLTIVEPWNVDSLWRGLADYVRLPAVG